MTCFYEKKAKKKFFFLRKKIQNGRLKKTTFFKIANSQNFFAKISQIGPWVSRIDWCEGHWWGSMYVVSRLSDISSKTAKKHKKGIFSLYQSLCRTASRPYTLSHINTLRINQSYSSKDQSVKFSRKNFENWRSVFLILPFWFFSQKKTFLLHSHENQSKFIW